MECGRELVAIGVVFAAVAVALANLKFADKCDRLRDQILTGVLDGQRLSIEHRETILSNDWLPRFVGTGTLSLVSGMILLMIPYFYGPAWDLWVICALGAVVPLLAAVSSLTFGVLEFRALSAFLANVRNAARSS